MASMVGTNGQSFAQNTATNIQGLSTQARLGSQARQQELSSTQSMTPANCSYILPSTSNSSIFLSHAFDLEATLCGALSALRITFERRLLTR